MDFVVSKRGRLVSCISWTGVGFTCFGFEGLKNNSGERTEEAERQSSRFRIKNRNRFWEVIWNRIFAEHLKKTLTIGGGIGLLIDCFWPCGRR
jgi:hypothetical protein